MRTLAFILVGLTVASSGCETLSGQQRRQGEMRRYSEIANLKASVKRLEQRIEGIETSQEEIYTQIADLRDAQDRSENQRDANLQAIESRLTAQSAAQARMRKDLVAELSGKMATIIKTQSQTTQRHQSEVGYEHVVKSGETLSEIAREYKVSVSVVVKANKLKSADDLRIGQTLFIPE
jgi:LysM repeat protein